MSVLVWFFAAAVAVRNSAREVVARGLDRAADRLDAVVVAVDGWWDRLDRRLGVRAVRWRKRARRLRS